MVMPCGHGRRREFLLEQSVRVVVELTLPSASVGNLAVERMLPLFDYAMIARGRTAG